MQIALPPLDPADRLQIEVDPDAEPSDWDEALAEFLLKYVSKRRSADPAATELSILNPGELEVMAAWPLLL